MTSSGTRVARVLRILLTGCAPLTIVALAGTMGNAGEIKPKPITVTGCLQKGSDANEFVLITKGGKKKYEVVSTSLALAGHVGHTVRITGTFRKEEARETRAEEHAEKKSGEEKAEEHQAGHIEATTLTMVSTTCS